MTMTVGKVGHTLLDQLITCASVWRVLLQPPSEATAAYF